VLASLTPSRRRGVEILDGDVPLPLRERSHRDIAVANAVFGGTRALLSALGDCIGALPREATFLDVGTGTGEAAGQASGYASRRGIHLDTIALDVDPGLAAGARRHATHAVCGSALQLPFADHSVDVVACAQLAHHFEGGDLGRLVREMNRVARRCVIISDLRRSWLAAGGLWMASFPLGFHPVSRHDGIVSILRGFTVLELESLVYDTCGVRPTVRRRAAFRLTAAWTPALERRR
jgi:SAM-dependent methyltransferase